MTHENPRVPGTQGYQHGTEALAAQYDELRFEDVHSHVLHLFPAAPGHVLDIGAGSGRDAAALARRGHAVTAVEPTPEMRRIGQRLHADQPITWIDDHLPHLHTVRQADRRYDLILLTAVWMHLNEPERSTAMAALDALLAEGGCIAMTLRHGPVPEGRRMFDVSGEETIALAASCGMRCAHRSERAGMFGRPDVSWTRLLLQRA